MVISLVQFYAIQSAMKEEGQGLNLSFHVFPHVLYFEGCLITLVANVFFFQILQWCALKEEVLGVDGCGQEASNNVPA